MRYKIPKPDDEKIKDQLRELSRRYADDPVDPDRDDARRAVQRASANIGPAREPIPRTRRSSLADSKWGLAWSNPNVSPEVLVRSALLTGSYMTVLEAVVEEGMELVRVQWSVLVRSDNGVSKRLRVNVERMLDNIQKGFDLAGGGDPEPRWLSQADADATAGPIEKPKDSNR
jgi:hypothetical protein